MPIIQILLLFVLVGGLSLLVLQNLSPVLPIVFLGMKTQALPLATWILGALAAGFLTSLCIQFFSYLQRRSLLVRIRQLEASPSKEPEKRRETAQTASRQTSYTPPPPEPETPTSEDTSEEWDDWEVEEAPEDDDWDFDEEPKRPEG
ncbi:MAG: LapA family protein, partial [Crinalium sp.]